MQYVRVSDPGVWTKWYVATDAHNKSLLLCLLSLIVMSAISDINASSRARA